MGWIMVSMLWIQTQNKATQLEIQSEIDSKEGNSEIYITSVTVIVISLALPADLTIAEVFPSILMNEIPAPGSTI